jgi:ATP synthase protein I
LTGPWPDLTFPGVVDAAPNFFQEGVIPALSQLNKGKPERSSSPSRKEQTSLEELDVRLRHAQDQRQPAQTDATNGEKGSFPGLGVAFRVGTELISALVVGVGIGLLLDSWLETGPGFLIAFFFLGAAAGIMNVYRAASGFGASVGFSGRNKKDKEQERHKERG